MIDVLDAFARVRTIATIGDQPVATPYIGYQALGGLSVAKALTIPSGARWAIVQPEGQPVRLMLDATSPTASVGMPLAVGATLEVTTTLAKLRAIEIAPGATLHVWYFG